MQVRVAAVDHHLLARKVCVPEGRGHIDHRQGLKWSTSLAFTKAWSCERAKAKKAAFGGRPK